MDLANKNALKTLLEKHRIAPRKRWGQNFLVSRAVLEKFIEAAHISKNDTALEIGPGVGTLTVELAKRAKKVIAVEKDVRLINVLKETTGALENVRIVPGDIRKLDPKRYTLNAIPYKLAGNLPFYLTNFIIRKFLESDAPPKDMTFIVQKEVAERICAKPPKMNLLAVSVQFYGEPKLISRAAKNSFWPQPEVDSAILRITTLVGSDPTRGVRPPRDPPNKERFFELVRAGFAHPRKYLAGNLSKKLGIPRAETERALAESNINLKARAENLGVEQWLALSKILRA